MEVDGEKHLEKVDVDIFREKLITWGHENFRNFPWRETSNPYQLLIAESLLHRTQAKQVVEVYKDFIRNYPDVQSLALADRDELEGALYSLGLFWRIDLIMDMAHDLVEQFDGQVPDDMEDLLSLPGVGPYIASSVRCFAFNYPDAIIDTNVMRSITRVFSIPFRDSLRRNRKFMTLAERLVDPANPRSYNYAILDLANQVCKPKIPYCTECPLMYMCQYAKFRENHS